MQTDKKQYNIVSRLGELAHKESVDTDRFWETTIDFAVLAKVLGSDARLLAGRDNVKKISMLVEARLTGSPLQGIDVTNMALRVFELSDHTLLSLFSDLLGEKLNGKTLSNALFYALSKTRAWSMTSQSSLSVLAQLIISPKGNEKILVAGELSAGAVYELCVNQNANSVNLLPQIRIQFKEQLKKLLFIADMDVAEIPKEEVPFIEGDAFEAGMLMDAFGSKHLSSITTSKDYLGLSREVSQLEFLLNKVNGRVVTLIPMGWLWKTTGDDFLLKEVLLASGKIEAVIQLPSKILRDTSVSTALLVLNTAQSNDRIAFIDASSNPFVKQLSRSEIALDKLEEIIELISVDNSEYSRLVSHEEVKENNLNLDPKRYVISRQEADLFSQLEGEELVSLDSIAEVIVCQSIKTEQDIGRDGKSLEKITPSDINKTGQILPLDLTFEYPKPGQERQIKRQLLKLNDILYSTKGVIGKCAIVSEANEGMIAAQSFVIIRLKKELKETYTETLFFFLQSILCLTLIDRAVTGAAMKFVKTEDIRSLKVPMPTLEKQKENQVEYSKLVKLEEKRLDIEHEIEEKLKSYWGQ